MIGAVIAAQRLIGLKSRDTTSRKTNPLVVAILLMAFTQNGGIYNATSARQLSTGTSMNSQIRLRETAQGSGATAALIGATPRMIAVA